jgi:N-acetylglucosaminyldiphosphoundecaprenol N-acetyl-beta-D-mannosaminyltransferase
MGAEALVLGKSSHAPAVTSARALHDAGPRVVELRRERVDLGGTLVDRVDLAMAVERMRGFLSSGSPHQIMTVNLDFLTLAEQNRDFRETINGADLAVADGMPLVWVSRLQRERLPERIAGVELVNEACQMAASSGVGVFLLGAAPGVADAAALRLEHRIPGLRVVGAYSPPFGPLTPEENARIIDMIRAAKPGYLFVALGAPHQDLWIREHRDQLDVPVAMGVGCVLDLLAGRVSRAPMWMQRSGLEWSYRLIHEPRRLWRRYIVDDLPMLVRLVVAARRTNRSQHTAMSQPLVGPR